MEEIHLRIDITIAAHIAFYGYGGEMIAPALENHRIIEREQRIHVCDAGTFEPGSCHHFSTATVAAVKRQHRTGKPGSHLPEKSLTASVSE